MGIKGKNDKMVVLACEDCKERNYTTTKNKKTRRREKRCGKKPHDTSVHCLFYLISAIHIFLSSFLTGRDTPFMPDNNIVTNFYQKYNT